MSEKKRFLLRLAQDLYAVIEKWAADELRSVNAQVEYLLKESVQRSGRWKGKKTDKHSAEKDPPQAPPNTEGGN